MMDSLKDSITGCYKSMIVVFLALITDSMPSSTVLNFGLTDTRRNDDVFVTSSLDSEYCTFYIFKPVQHRETTILIVV